MSDAVINGVCVIAVLDNFFPGEHFPISDRTFSMKIRSQGDSKVPILVSQS